MGNCHLTPVLLHAGSPRNLKFTALMTLLLIIIESPRFCRPACVCAAGDGPNLSRAAELFFPFPSPECNDATLSFQTLPPTAGDKWDLQKTGDRKIAAFILTAFWQTMHKTFLGKGVSLTICVEDVLLGKWCIRGVAK